MSFILQGSQIYIFLTKGGYTLVDGYPKRLEKEFGSPHGISLETVNAAFTCPGSSRLHIMAGERHLDAKEWLVLLCLCGIDPHQGMRRTRLGCPWYVSHVMSGAFFPGRKLWWLDLKLGAQATWTELPWPHEEVDGALCTEKSLGPNSCSASGTGLYIIHGANLYCYSDVEKLSTTKTLPHPLRVDSLLGCSH